MGAPERATSLPLSGIRVIDLVQGPLQSVGKMLADLGAEVVLVEPAGGSPARWRGEMRLDESLDFAIANRGKRSIVADVATPEGRRILDTLLHEADLCLVDSPEAVGDIADPLLVPARYPRLAVVSMTEFGRTGPQKSWTSTPDVHSALSTTLSRSGLPSVASPLLPPEFLAYGAVAAQALFAALAALYHSIAAEAGEIVDLSVSEALMHVLDPVFGIGGTARGGRSMWDLPPGRPDASHMYPVFPALDGWLRICVLSPRQWSGIFEWMGRPERFADDRYASTQTRYAEADALHPHFAELFSGITRAQAVERGHSFGVPIAPLLSTGEVLSTSHYREAGSIGDFRFADRAIVAPTGVFDLDGMHVDASRPAPGLDEAHGLADRRRIRPQWNLPTSRERPLEGLRVLDLGVIVVGGELGRLLADLGAEVIKVESSAFPDGSRLAGDMSESFAWGHRNKLSMGLDLRSDIGRAAFCDLVRRSDIVLANFKPGTLQKLGFGYEALSSLNPGIILSESSAFGNSGPWSTRMGYGPLVRASAGLSLLWQYPEVEGSFSDAVTIYPDHAVARLNAAAIIALLLRRGRTGRGGAVSTAQVDAILDAMAVPIALESLDPGSVTARGNAREVDAPRGVFRAAGDDEWTVIDVQGDEVFAALAGAIGRPEWATDPEFATAAGRLAARDVIRIGVEAWTRLMPAADAARRLQHAGVPAGDMRRPQDLLSNTHLAERRALGSLHQPQLPRVLPAFTGEASFSTIPDPPMRPAPSRGEHTREIAERVLGWNADRIRAAIATGVIEVASPATSSEAEATGPADRSTRPARLLSERNTR